ncbi:hypothetical protein G3480_23860 [Thiorhodococcus mannitoliphagus]|uniref:Uncharacterized protein n=1 Tax=Thiorhodococcus mannitoliphagus TaxID=329406 RepID=A0A6P1E6X0_9GAMM|nr:hypothetical protein [Thiorhodococcus mannitoliphagus]NEX23295.1 hypothetical protein [Thiorhodococcus mannitoliphagus]
MLTINDLTADRTLDKAAMSGVRGGLAVAGSDLASFFGYFNSPTLDLGTHELAQSQAVAIDQSGATGGFNISGASQTQNGISGQVSLF